MVKNNLVRCGCIVCDMITECPHFKEHKPNTECNESCIRSGNKCYNTIEMRKFKLKKLEERNEN